MGVIEETKVLLSLDLDVRRLAALNRTTGISVKPSKQRPTRPAKPPPQHKRELNMQQQTQSNWCWAATTVSITRFYESNSTLTQCQLVNQHFGRTDCCTSPASGNCNNGSDTAAALRLVGHLQQDPDGDLAGTLTFAKVRQQIALGRPVQIRIDWDGGGAHAIALDGYADSDGGEWVYGDDPGSGNAFIQTYSSFKTKYRTTGNWTRSRLTS